MADAIRKSRAPKIYVCNVMTQPGETEGYSAYDHVEALLQHGGEGIVDYCLVNTGEIESSAVKKYALDGVAPVVIDEEKFRKTRIKLIKADVADEGAELARHNPQKLARVIDEFYESLSSSLISVHNF